MLHAHRPAVDVGVEVICIRLRLEAYQHGTERGGAALATHEPQLADLAKGGMGGSGGAGS